jgi:hypothetical protein
MKKQETKNRNNNLSGSILEKIKGIENAYISYGDMCSECQHDENIEHPRDADAKCLICGALLCGGHVMKHLEEKHCVGTHLY